MTKLNIINIMAYDNNGNHFNKIITLFIHKDTILYEKDTVSFGEPVKYYLSLLVKSYPFNTPFCIDHGGILHQNSSVFILSDDMNRIFNTYILAKKGIF